MGSYSVRYICDGRYVIGDDEYGFDLVTLDFHDNLIERLSDKEQSNLLSKISKEINLAMENESELEIQITNMDE